MAHRNYANGSVRKERSGHWLMKLTWYEGEGKERRQRSIYKNSGVACGEGDEGKVAAKEKLKRWRDKLIEEQDRAEGVVSSRTPFATYAQTYLRDLPVKESTMQGYRAALSHVDGTDLGAKAISKITDQDLKGWIRDLKEIGLKPTTIAHYHGFVAQVLNVAQNRGDIRSNPAHNYRSPKPKRKPVNSLTKDGLDDLNEKLDTLGPSPLSTAARIAVKTGMRRAEVCALRWQDVDFDDRMIHVVHSLTKAGGSYVMDTPKSTNGGDSTRDIVFGRNLEGYLLERKQLMSREAEELGIAWDDRWYVVGSVTEGKWMNPNILTRQWSALAAAEGWRGTQGETPRFHDLRHTFATHAVNRHMDIEVLAAMLGHEDATTTLNIYATPLKEAMRQSMDILDEYMG